ncbi:phage tail fiber protein [Methylobacterium sp. CM6246]
MSVFLNAAKAVMLDALAAQAGFVSLHTADPGSTGASEMTGTGYARTAVTWGASAAGAKQGVGAKQTVPAGKTVAFLGMWTAATGGTFLGGLDCPDEAYTSAGDYTATLNLALADS